MITTLYSTGQYYQAHADFDADAPGKAADFLDLFLPVAAARGMSVTTYADVGCGGGRATALTAAGLRAAGHRLEKAYGYDVSPHVQSLVREGVEFREEDFTQAQTHVDLVTLYDVFEHVPDPVGFLRRVADRCHYVGLHVPLENHLVNGLFNRSRRRLADPGHLLVLDHATALNMIAMAGVTVLDYAYTMSCRAPSGNAASLFKRLTLPVRTGAARLNPWLASRLIGGVSLMVVGATPRALETA